MVGSVEPKDVKVSVTGTASRGFGRDAQWKVTLFGLISGYGATQAEAREAAIAALGDAVRQMHTAPEFARDDDGTLIVAVPDGGGTAVYRVDSRARNTEFRYGTPEQAVTGAHHYTRIPRS